MNDFEIVLKKFNDYFVPEQSIIHGGACFHPHSQKLRE